VQEKAALKKLENVKTDHAKRLDDLAKEQTTDMQKAQLIEINLSLVTSRASLFTMQSFPSTQASLERTAIQSSDLMYRQQL